MFNKSKFLSIAPLKIKIDWYTLIMLAACVVLSFILYARSIDSYFVSEDLRHINYDWPELKAEFSASGQVIGFRPGTVLYIVINNKLWGRNPIGHHAVVFFLHGLIGFLTYLVTLRVTKSKLTGTLAAFLFISAPVHSEAVIWLAAASGTVISGLICMIAAWLWIREGQDRSHLTLGIVIVLYFLALLVKEVAAPLPALLLLLELSIERFPKLKFFKKWIYKILSYWPFGTAFGLYIFLHWKTGYITSSYLYGVHLDTKLENIIEIWSVYARDLFMPISNFLKGVIGEKNWIWLLIFIFLLLVFRRKIWASLWLILALLPGATAYGKRLSYLAIVGFSIFIASLLTDLAVQPHKRLLYKRFRVLPLAGVSILVFIWIAASTQAVHRDAANWREAGRLTWTIPRKAHALISNVPSGAELFFLGLPDNINGAYAFRWGLAPETRYVFGNPKLKVFQVIDGPTQPGKISLSSVEYKAKAPRFLFRYYAETDELRLVNPAEFGLNHSPNKY